MIFTILSSEISSIPYGIPAKKYVKITELHRKRISRLAFEWNSCFISISAHDSTLSIQ